MPHSTNCPSRQAPGLPGGVVLAFDNSARYYDIDGRLHVENCAISKATVNPYLGREIPGSDALGLDPDRVYYMLRDPAELARAADSFTNLQLLAAHVGVSASSPRQDITVGTVGDVYFDAPYLRTRLLTVWAADAIAAIKARTQCELSCSYRYRADMTPGDYAGMKYDGVMRDIIGNHVALVEEGRAGPDVVVSDSKPKGAQMKTFPKLTAALAPFLAAGADLNALRAVLASDSAQAEILGRANKPSAEDEMTDEEMRAAEDAWREENERASDAEMSDEEKESAYAAAKDRKARDMKRAKDKRAADKRAADKRAKDAGNDPDGEAARPAMDANAVAAMIRKAEESAVARVTATFKAREAVRPVCGEVTFDSADDIYRFALSQLGVPTDGVHASAFPAMLDLAKRARTGSAALAQDSAARFAAAPALESLFN